MTDLQHENLRNLCGLHEEGVLDRRAYRSARRQLIDAVVAGELPPSVVKDPDRRDEAEEPTVPFPEERLAAPDAVLAGHQPGPSSGGKTPPPSTDARYLAGAAALLAALVVALWWTWAGSPAVPERHQSIEPPSAVGASPLTEHLSRFLDQEDWSPEQLMALKSAWYAAGPADRAALKAHLDFRRLETAAYARMTEAKAVASATDDPDLLRQQRELVDLARVFELAPERWQAEELRLISEEDELKASLAAATAAPEPPPTAPPLLPPPPETLPAPTLEPEPAQPEPVEPAATPSQAATGVASESVGESNPTAEAPAEPTPAPQPLAASPEPAPASEPTPPPATAETVAATPPAASSAESESAAPPPTTAADPVPSVDTQPQGKAAAPSAAAQPKTTEKEPTKATTKRPGTSCRAELANSRKPFCRDKLVGGGNGPTLAVLPPGEFAMGSARPGEGPVRKLRITKPFAMAVEETSVKEYLAYCKAIGRACGIQPWPSEEFPVVRVTWQDAVAYTEWLSAATGARYRLPSEVEWEYAARAGTTSTYPFGEELLPVHAQFVYQTPPEAPLPRSDKRVNRNGFRLLHTVGNVREWVADVWEDDYAGAGNDSAPRQGSSPLRVVRGGSYRDSADALRSSARMALPAGSADDQTGFRVVLELP